MPRPELPSGEALAGTYPEAFRDCNVCPEMVVIPAGEFVMGSPRIESVRATRERPQHTVRIELTFALGRFEVTRAEYAAFALDTGHRGMDCAVGGPIGPAFGGARLDLTTNSWSDPSFAQTSRHPVVCVSWDDAKAYLSWLSRAAGKRSTASQAKPSGSTRHAREPRHYGFGGSAPPRRAISRTRRTKDRTGTTSTRTHSVPRRPTAAMTVTPTQGQWAGTQPTRSACTTCWGTFRSGSRTVQANCAPNDGSAWMAGDCEFRVLRGGDWLSWADQVRSAYRYTLPTDSRTYYLGIRVARTLDL